MIKKIQLFAALIFISTFGFGQISNVQDVRGVPLRTGAYDKIEGTPYFNGSDWMVGAMIDMNGKIYNNAQLRFNSFDNELEYLRNGGAIIVRKDQIKSFQVDVPNQSGSTESFYFSTGFEVKGEVDITDFVRVIYQGNKFSIVQKVFKKKSTVTPAAYGEQDYEKFIER